MEQVELRLNEIEQRIEAIEKWMASQIHLNDRFLNELNQIKGTIEQLGERDDPKSPVESPGSDALGG